MRKSAAGWISMELKRPEALTGLQRPIRRCFTVNLPDGTKRVEKLPKASSVRLGGLYIHPVTYKTWLIAVRFTRVKGGWLPVD